MRTVKTKVYKFDELNDEAKGKVIEQFSTQEYSLGNEVIETLKKGLDHFGATLKDYRIDFLNPGHSEVNFDIYNMDVETISSLLFELGEYNFETLKGEGDCKLTGMCFDEDFIDGVRESFFESEANEWKEGEYQDEDLEYLLREMMESGIDSLLDSAMKDYEHQLSEEGIKDHCEANEIEFTEDGSIF